jgi:SAM-dependent methyltransferase
MKCRFCKYPLKYRFLDLANTPLANSYLTKKELNKPEVFFPLCAYVCKNCFLVQLDEVENPSKIFSNYAYFSSYSKTWLNHCKILSEEIVKRFNINKENRILEIASNDGYLLKNFKEKKIPILGIEPASNIAKIAKKNGIPTINKFFSEKTANELNDQGKTADVLIAINVLPHVPNLNDFIKGMKKILNPKGVIIIQFSAYLLQLILQREFDVIYHEHYSYFSLFTLKKIFSKYGLKIFDVEEIKIHGGSLRIFITHKNNNLQISKKINNLIMKERKKGLKNISTYTNFGKTVNELKLEIWKFFINANKSNKKIIFYGAPAKGNTLLNFCGIKSDIVKSTADISPHKQNLYLPGSHIPIYHPNNIKKEKPDYVVILAWNLKDEIIQQLSFIRKWGGKFVILVPKVKIIDDF